MKNRELSISEANDYLLGLFRSLLEIEQFREYIDQNYVIKQYFDGDGEVLRVEITHKDGSDEIKQEIKEFIH